MSELLARRGGSEGYEARDDDKQEKAPALLWTAKNAVDAVLLQRDKKSQNQRLFPDANSKNGGFSNMKDKKDRHTVWMKSETWGMVEGHYRGDNCSTKNEYIERVVRFYSGYLDAAGADEYLPRVLSDVLEGKLGALGSRVGRLMFKLAVEQDLTANILAAMAEINLDAVEHTRAQCVQQVKKVNGEIKLEDTLRAHQRLD